MYEMVIKRRTKIAGLDNLNKMLDQITDPKFRAKVLRKAGNVTLKSVEGVMIANSPNSLKDQTKRQLLVNTNKPIKINKKGFISEKKFHELWGHVTYKPGVMGYGLAMILENGRSDSQGDLKKDGSTKWYAWGNPTSETIRNIGTTKPLRFVEKTFFEVEKSMAVKFGNTLLDEIQKEVKRQSKRKALGK